MNDELNRKIIEIKEKVGKTSLHMARIPEEAKTRFISFCAGKFAGDYGMALMWLMDYYEGKLPNQNEEITFKIETLAEQVVVLANEIIKIQNQPQMKRIRSVSGRTITEQEVKK